MNEIYPPFTKYYGFTGPNVAISCNVDYDKENHEYVAKSSNGFHGTGDSAEAAALNCFMAWMTPNRGWFRRDER